ncbi:MAG: site-specific integrase, partial [Prevotella sp.]|nr:site-specific integrase [Prevotella sp.]
MKDIKEIVQDIAIKLRGHNALIQIQIDGQYFVKRIGNINQLIDNPKITTYKEDGSFLDWMESEVDKETYTAGTIANHKATLAVLRRFKEDITFTQVDYKCICDFENFLKSAGYAINTIAKFMKIFRRFVNLAIDEELMTVYPFRKYHIKTENVQKQSLTERELRRIEDKEEKEELTEEERKVVKGFLFSIYSGLRFSDIVQVTKQHIKNIYRNKWVVMRMQKTDHEVRIPISKMFGGKAATMIQENKTTTGKLFQLPCNARCNLVLKR